MSDPGDAAVFYALGRELNLRQATERLIAEAREHHTIVTGNFLSQPLTAYADSLPEEVILDWYARYTDDPGGILNGAIYSIQLFDYVWVRLNPVGVSTLVDYLKRTNEEYAKLVPPMKNEDEEDLELNTWSPSDFEREDGWWEFQLWQLVAIFGPALKLIRPDFPFESEIRILDPRTFIPPQ